MKRFGRFTSRRVSSLVHLLSALTAVASPPLLFAQSELAPAAANAVPIRSTTKTQPRHAALTIEGGGTLGAYEGGLTWAVMEVFRRKRINNLDSSYTGHLRELFHASVVPAPLGPEAERILDSLYVFDISAAAGASAGSINSFIAANRWCSLGQFETEEHSPFWDVWIPTGWVDLFPRHGVNVPGDEPGAIFQRAAFKPIFDKLERAWSDSLSHYDPNCVVSFGATMTRLAEDSLYVSSRVWARNQRYLAAFTVAPPTATSHGPRYLRPSSQVSDRIRLGALVELPPGPDGTIPHALAHDVVKASSGYPLAFEPYRVRYCPSRDATHPSDTVRICSDATAVTAPFVDGGVFDNGPLTMAYGMSLADPANISLDNLYMLFVNPDNRRITRRRQDVFAARRIATDQPADAGRPAVKTAFGAKVAATDDSLRGLDAVSKLVGTFIPSARQYELQIAGRFLPTIQLFDRRGDALTAQISTMKGDKDLQAARADGEYALRRLDLNAARLTKSSSTYVRDTLRKSLATCRVLPQSCKPLTEDSLIVFPHTHQDSLQAFPQLRLPTDTAPDPVLVGTVPSDTTGIPRLPFDSLLYTSDRWHPLGGEWLFGFGGLLGRPLREYDFYVGVYDGLSLIARYFSCYQKPTDECRGAALQRLLADPPLKISTRADTVLRALYQSEYGDAVGRRAAQSEVDTTTETRALLALVDAMVTRMSTTPLSRRECRQGGPIEQLTCAQGMDRVLERLRDSASSSVSAVYPSTCSDSVSSRERCVIDPLFIELVNDPNVAMNRLTGELLARVSFATPNGSGLKFPLTMANAMYMATNERSRQGLDFGSTSLPLPSLALSDRLALFLIPSSFGVTAGMSGWYYEWALRKHISANYALGGAARVVWRSRLWRPGERAVFRHFVPSVRAERKFGGSVAPWISTFGAEVSYWNDFGLSQFWRQWNGITVGATTAVLAQRVRLSIYRRPSKYITASMGRPAVFFTIGVGDVNGVVYWLGKMIKERRARPGL